MRIEDNMWKFYIYRILASLIFVTPIFVLFLLENNLTMTQVMVLQGYYAVIIAVFQIPGGAFADFFGRKKAIIYSTLFYLAGYTSYALGNSFFTFMIAETFIAVSVALWSSASSAFVYDTLAVLGKEADFKKIYGSVTALNYVMGGIAALAGGYLASAHGLRFTFWMTAIPVAIACIIPFLFVEPYAHKPSETSYALHLKEAAGYLWEHPKIKLFIIYCTVFIGIGGTVFYFYQPYLKLLKIDILYFGVIFFLMDIAAAVGSKFAHKLDRIFGEKIILYALPTIMALSLLFMGKLLLPFAAVFCITLFFSQGLFEPVVEDYMNRHIQTHHRATMLSFKNFSGQLLIAALSPFMGYAADLWSVQAAFLISAAIIFFDLIILYALMHIKTDFVKWTPKTAE